MPFSIPARKATCSRCAGANEKVEGDTSTPQRLRRANGCIQPFTLSPASFGRKKLTSRPPLLSRPPNESAFHAARSSSAYTCSALLPAFLSSASEMLETVRLGTFFSPLSSRSSSSPRAFSAPSTLEILSAVAQNRVPARVQFHHEFRFRLLRPERQHDRSVHPELSNVVQPLFAQCSSELNECRRLLKMMMMMMMRVVVVVVVVAGTWSRRVSRRVGRTRALSSSRSSCCVSSPLLLHYLLLLGC